MNSAIDLEHIIPVGLTMSLRVVIPLIDCLVGIESIDTFDPLAPAFEVHNGYNTGQPMVDWAMQTLVWDTSNPLTSVNKPVPKLATSIGLQVANGQSIDVVGELTDWFFTDVIPAVLVDLPGLAAAVVAQAAGKIALSAALQLLGAFTVPWLLAIIKAAMITQTILDVAPSTWDLAFTSWNVEFALIGTGTGTVTVRTMRGRLR